MSSPDLSPLDAPVSFFRGVRATKRPATLPLRDALEQIRTGAYRALVETVRAVADQGERQKAKRTRLPVVTLSGTFESRCNNDLVQHSGIVGLDFDHVADLAGLRAALVASPHVLATFLSVSGDGLKALVPVVVVDEHSGELRPPQDNAEHRRAFEAAAALFGPGPAGGQGPAYRTADLDEGCKDVSRACYVSLDPDLYVNESAVAVEAAPPAPPRSARPSRHDAAPPRPQAPGDAQTEADRVRSALLAVPARPDYKDWIRVIAAVLDAVGGSEAEAEALLCQWSPEEEPGEYRAKMREGLSHVKAGTLFYLAKQHGWTPPSRTERASGRGSARQSPKYPKSPSSTVSSGETVLSPAAAPAAETAPVLPWEPFPVHLLPRAASDYVLAQAAAIGCDAAFVAVPVLGVLAASVGNSHRIQIKRSWQETATLWLAVIARSGQHKSPALTAALRPVYAREKRASDRWEREKESYDESLSLWSSLTKKERLNTVKPILPVRRRYRIADATVESVAVRHEENPRGLALVRDELAGFFASFDRYASGGGDAQTWIEMAEGRPVVIDRKSADKPVTRVERPAVCVLGGTQPGVLQGKLTAPLFDAGLVARLLMVEPLASPRRFTEDDVEQEVYLAYESLVAAAYDRHDEGPALPLSPDAKALFVAFYDAAAKATEHAASDRLRAAFVKLDGYCARLALVFHVHDTPPEAEPGPVSLWAMARAVRLTLWFRRETARLYALYGFHETAALDRDARLAGELPSPFAWQDVAEAWGVQKAGAYKIIKRLTERALVADDGHGRFHVSPKETVDDGDCGDFGDGSAPRDGVKVALDMERLDKAIAAGLSDRDGLSVDALSVDAMPANALPEDAAPAPVRAVAPGGDGHPSAPPPEDPALPEDPAEEPGPWEDEAPF